MTDEVPPEEPEAEVEESEALKAAKEQLSPFLLNNPQANVIEVQTDAGPLLVVGDPWGDESLAIRILDDSRAELIEALNNVLLPPVLTALYHLDSQKLEVIWTAFKLGAEQEEIFGRAFEFQRGAKTHKCSFTKSSDRLMEIAKGWIALKNSVSNWRNLRSFHHYAFKEEDSEDEALSPFNEPISLWIENVAWDEEGVLDLIRNLNFYMLLYDYASSTILIHAVPDPLSINPRTRYLWDMFPDKIVAKDVDQNLVSYWVAAHEAASAAEKFLNFYRIIEYVAYHHVERETRRAIKRVMSSPHVGSTLDQSASEVIDLIREFRVQQENERIGAVVRETVKPELLWKEVCVNPDYFTAEVEFDGGLTIEKLANTATDPTDIPAQLLSNFVRSAIKIRNALAHGKDKQTGHVVLPTIKNMAKIIPWVHLISAVAAEVMLYEKLD